jgi:penicillin amidase
MRATARISAFLLLGLIVVVAGGYYWLRTSLPEAGGQIALDGLEHPVSVIRDANAVPQIYAESKHDAYFALGFVHAQDRLWQMEFLRRLGAGRLAEILGAKVVRTDQYIRTLGIPHVAEANYANSPPAVQAALKAYADGVNAWLATRGGALPPEFVLLRYEPEPWRPVDPLLWSRLMATRLGRNQGAETMRLRVAEALAENGLPANLIEDLWPRASADEPITVAGDLLPAKPAALQDSGSNGWIVHGQRTASGKPILANDPHLRFGAPILWYLAYIEAPGMRLTGATVPGVPFMVLGHNGTIAWGMTNGGGDVEDLFIETVDPDDPKKYLTPDGPRTFATRREIIQVKDDDPVEITVRETRHGPVVSDLLRKQKGDNKVAVLSTPALRGDDGTVVGLMAINDANSWPDFERAAQRFHTPHTNLFYASVAGDIGLISAGRIPVRKAGTGFAPVQGADGAYDWTGFIPKAELPRLFNPPSGWIANANNRIVGDDYPYLMTWNWGPPYRAERIAEILRRQETHDIAQSQALQRDSVSTAARRLLPLMLAVPMQDARERRAVALLSAWNHAMRRDRPEPLIYATWLRHLGRGLIADEIGGPKASAYKRLVNRPGARFVHSVLTDKQRWCDDVTTPEPESCADQLSASLKTALDELDATQDGDMVDWRWGTVHRATFAHPVLTHAPLAAPLANMSIESDGGDHTVNRGMTAGQGHPIPETHMDGSGYRAVYDLADLENSRFMIATGQSGNILSPHYGDFLERWRDGKYIKIAGGRDVLARPGRNILRLEPK